MRIVLGVGLAVAAIGAGALTLLHTRTTGPTPGAAGPHIVTSRTPQPSTPIRTAAPTFASRQAAQFSARPVGSSDDLPEFPTLYVAETVNEVRLASFDSPTSTDSAIELPPPDEDPGVLAGVFLRQASGGRIEKQIAPGSYHACWADCDKSQQLDIYDFLCFQELFMRGVDTACDCETSSGRGVCDVFDLICFQERFAEGCG